MTENPERVLPVLLTVAAQAAPPTPRPLAATRPASLRYAGREGGERTRRNDVGNARRFESHILLTPRLRPDGLRRGSSG